MLNQSFKLLATMFLCAFLNIYPMHPSNNNTPNDPFNRNKNDLSNLPGALYNAVMASIKEAPPPRDCHGFVKSI